MPFISFFYIRKQLQFYSTVCTHLGGGGLEEGGGRMDTL